ncbi:MAG: UDP-2,3-diacylglucosamine diphosphatase [Xanthomonadales bacterium]|nr:UDP-2,3-diacylglucosamine diphosphatase [Xanthomonadales bacterium]
MRRRAVHTTADGRRLLVTHGDEFDDEVRLGGAGEWLGEWLYERILLGGNRRWNRLRARFGYRYFSLAGFLKRQSSGAERYIARFRAAVLADVRRRGLDGVVCGHIHRPELREIDGLVYANDGDWVESPGRADRSRDGTLALRQIRIAGRVRSRTGAAALDRRGGVSPYSKPLAKISPIEAEMLIVQSRVCSSTPPAMLVGRVPVVSVTRRRSVRVAGVAVA